MPKILEEHTNLPYAFDLHDDIKRGVDILRCRRDLVKDPKVLQLLSEHGFDTKEVVKSTRYTPEHINELYANEIFVYGSNRAGIHGAGAARQALSFGAVFGMTGPVGLTYGISTKDENIQTLPLSEIKKEVDAFIKYAQDNTWDHFLVTKIGMGLAGYKLEDIAPLFEQCRDIENVSLPIEFFKFYENKNAAV